MLAGWDKHARRVRCCGARTATGAGGPGRRGAPARRGWEGCERVSRAQERFVPFERLTAPTDGNKFGTISGLNCGRTSLGFAFNLEPAAEAFFGQY